MSCGRLSRASDAWRARFDAAHKGVNAIFVQPLSDTAFMSFRGGGYCQCEHENESACHFHYHEGHQGSLQDCGECRRFFGEDAFTRRREGPGNEPFYEMKSIEIGERRDQIPGKKYCPLRLGFRRLSSDVRSRLSF